MYDGVSRWYCSECLHEHTGRQYAYICIGCPCDFVPDHPEVEAQATLHALLSPTPPTKEPS